MKLVTSEEDRTITDERTKVFSNNNRPKVLIIGNGIVRNGKNPSWEDMIKKLAAEEFKNIELPKSTPYSLKATVMTDKDDNDRFNKYYKQFSDDYHYEENEYLDRLLRLPFDTVLTTNYTYEIEHQLNKKYADLSRKTKGKYANHTSKKDSRYLIHTFNRIPNNEYKCNDVWHIHGEQRRKTSIILTHNEYIKLINKEVDYLHRRKNEYEENSDNIAFRSWIDYFVLGELYIVGLGLDFSEFDLWWLINRRFRENINKNNMPPIHLFEPKYKNTKKGKAELPDSCKVLEVMNGEIFDMSVVIDRSQNNEEKASRYQKFYKKTVTKIEQMMKGE